MRRLTDDDGIVHAFHNGTIDVAFKHTTACGIIFEVYELPHKFRVIDWLHGPVMLCGSLERLEVTCMTCLVRMQSWNQ